MRPGLLLVCTVFADLALRRLGLARPFDKLRSPDAKKLENGSVVALQRDSQPAEQARRPLRTLAGSRAHVFAASHLHTT
jgi:hypothetical protein